MNGGGGNVVSLGMCITTKNECYSSVLIETVIKTFASHTVALG